MPSKKKLLKYGKEYLKKIPSKMLGSQAVRLITDNGHSAGTIPILGSVNETNVDQKKMDKVRSRLRYEGVPIEYADYRDVGPDLHEAREQGMDEDQAHNYAVQKAKGRMLDLRPSARRTRGMSAQSINTQPQSYTQYQDVMYQGDKTMPKQANDLPEDMILPAVQMPEMIEIRKKIKEQIINNDDDGKSLKHPRDWTQEELRDAMRERERANDNAKKKEMFEQERKWFEANYGTGDVLYDDTGQMIPPQPIRNIPKTPTVIKMKDGQNIDDAVDDVLGKLLIGGNDVAILPGQPQVNDGEPMTGKPIGTVEGQPAFDLEKMLQEASPEEIAELNKKKYSTEPVAPIKGEKEVVKGMQSGLNILTSMQNQSPLPNIPKIAKLKEDGVVGPKTSFALKKALVDNGTNKVSEALALGQFKETVKKAKNEGPQNLAGELGATFGPLLPKKKAVEQPEGLALQDTLNDFGANLKDDGIVGPKTEDAFGQIAKTKDEDELVNQFGYNLGFDF